jgi:rod shape-determining protein MreC
MRPATIIATLLFLALCGWVVMLSPAATRKLQSAGLAVVTPFLRAGSATEVWAKGFRAEARRVDELERENEQLRKELVLTRLYSKDRREVYEENQRLAEALEYRSRSPFELLPARVILRDRTTWWSTVVLDRGFNHQIALGAAVIAPEGLVGRILTVAPSSSVALLLTDENCQVAARTLGSIDVRGVVSGNRANTGGDPFLRMGPLPLGTRIEPGRAVFTTGSGGVFPPNFPVGSVERIEDRDFFTEALVKPAVDFLKLDQVFIVLSDRKGGAG